MPARGSAIGASGLGAYAGARAGFYGGNPLSQSPPAPAPPLASARMSVGVGYGATTPWLLGLVAAEVVLLIWLRQAFRNYHGG